MPLSTLDSNAALIVIDLQKGIVATPTLHDATEVVARAAKLAQAFRERDLPGHLPAEGPQGGNAARDGGATRIDGGTGGDIVSGTIARDIPHDPSSSQDVVLRVGYQMLRSQIGSRAVLAK